ncbi:hypothetical protein BKA70DRAFT_396558 [Coprinopsis sp. MPI-PUGE-AT-0042]|nr:hypothetical protein BKA70DRAFT_396558 [Coprinopsis sp. MPI-PUGE-AT-0042]
MASLLHLPSDPIASRGLWDMLKGATDFTNILGRATPRHPPLERLPCANVEVDQYSACSKPGTMRCSACKLVSYCSKECQKAHWGNHKQDCKNPLMSLKWLPLWVQENRAPSFVNDLPDTIESHFGNVKLGETLGVGISLWGNTPAIDLLNLSMNEDNSSQDYTIALAASGDLRHVVKTVNGLPANFSGKLTVVLNDGTTPVVARNLTLLLLLASESDRALAADLALHFWYSVFMPIEYQHKVARLVMDFLKASPADGHVPLGTKSNLILTGTGRQLDEIKSELARYSPLSPTLESAQAEYDRVRRAPSRRDLRDRMYANLQPSHRVAFQEYRRFGLVLPFGAINAHFNRPNPSLFSPEGYWWQKDYADPLEGWKSGDIVDAGKRHNATPEDIYGCMYFFLREQLREFADRLSKFHISFKLFASEASVLATTLREDAWSDIGLPSSIRFDRIAVSNILDKNYVGLEGTLTKWAPLLAQTKHAAIVGYFMNWALEQKDGRSTGAGRAVSRSIIAKMKDVPYFANRIARSLSTMGQEYASLSILNDMEIRYENSKPFDTYLKTQGLDHILTSMKLNLRRKHTIVPHIRRD